MKITVNPNHRIEVDFTREEVDLIHKIDKVAPEVITAPIITDHIKELCKATSSLISPYLVPETTVVVMMKFFVECPKNVFSDRRHIIDGITEKLFTAFKEDTDKMLES